MFHMLGTYAIYLDIGRDDDDDYDDRFYEIRKDSQTCGQRLWKNCEKVHF